MVKKEQPHKDNAPGPFYVCDDCCTACDVPFVETPDLFSYDDQNHCYVTSQPKTESELSRMIRTVLSAELECIRYSGTDPDVLRRLAESGYSHLADVPILDVKPVLRNHVTFNPVDSMDSLLSTGDLAIMFQSYLRSQENDYLTYKFRSLYSDGFTYTFEYSWFEDNYHKVEITFLGEPNCRWLIVTGTTFQIYDWLLAGNRFCDIRWYTRDQWIQSKIWQATPW